MRSCGSVADAIYFRLKTTDVNAFPNLNLSSGLWRAAPSYQQRSVEQAIGQVEKGGDSHIGQQMLASQAQLLPILAATDIILIIIKPQPVD